MSELYALTYIEFKKMLNEKKAAKTTYLWMHMRD